jgi:hypothetical protein
MAAVKGSVAMTMAANLSAGTDVYTSDGDKIGEVKEVRGRYFKVDAAGQPDYWLETECCAAGYTSGDVRLVFPKDMLGDHKIDESMVQAA